MRTSIVGAGPVGCVIGAHLLENIPQCGIYDISQAKISAIRQNGITLVGAIEKKVRVEHATTSLDELLSLRPDVLIVAVKGYASPQVAEALYERSFNGYVVCAQNGIDVEEPFVRALGEERVLRMVLNFGANMTGPSTARVNFFNPPNFIAPLDDSTMEVARQIADILTGEDFDTVAVSSLEMIKKVWEKTLMNAAMSPLSAIMRMTMGEIMAEPELVELVEALLEEGLQVALAERIQIDPSFIRMALRYLKRGGHHYPSLAIDFFDRKPTEISFMNGKIYEYGRKHYIRTPLNQLLFHVIRAMTEGHPRPFLTIPSPKQKKPGKVEACCGIDIGHYFAKFVLIDENGHTLHREAVPVTASRYLNLKRTLASISEEYHIIGIVATGSGSKYFHEVEDIVAEEEAILLALENQARDMLIVDVGGEKIKVITVRNGKIIEVRTNEKCSAGRGAFLMEVSSHLGIKPEEMDKMALQSASYDGLNSFCTVYARTQMLSLLEKGEMPHNVVRMAYVSVANLVAEMIKDTSLPIYITGGVVHHHPIIAEMIAEKCGGKVKVPEEPMYTGALGCALLARNRASVKYIKNY